MLFPFGIDKEAQIYCNSAKFALAQANQDEILPNIEATAINMINNGILEMPYSEFLQGVVVWTEESVQQQGWHVTDEDGVAWMIGLFVMSYIRAVDIQNGSAVSDTPRLTFETIFQDAFKVYFEDK